jgi:hypothetical protein
LFNFQDHRSEAHGIKAETGNGKNLSCRSQKKLKTEREDVFMASLGHRDRDITESNWRYLAYGLNTCNTPDAETDNAKAWQQC